MKKYLLIIAVLLTFSATSMAQTKEKAKATPVKAKTTTKTTARMAAPNATVVTVDPEAVSAKTKTDGSAVRQNKTTTKSTATKSTTKVKKDGTPDLRYKENKKKG